ncbi:MAG: glycine betaine catabolism, partial [Mycobacterium sp.]|nr:glycine betaine catabolism [Mycobacterium sp.]
MTATDFPASTGVDPDGGKGSAAAEAPSGSLIPTLGGEYYCNDRIFGLEQEHILEKMWFCAV